MFISTLVFLLIFLVFYLFTKFSTGRTDSKVCLVGKTAVVTGANTGIGYQIALNLASRGCRIIIADKTNANNAPETIFQQTNNANIYFKYLNLESLDSVRRFAQEIKEKEQKLHILINNAGIGSSSNKYTEDGLHPMMQCNTFGHFLLTHLLSDLLSKSAPSRVVFTSSMMAFTHNLTLSNLNYPQGHPNTALTNCRIYSNANLTNIIVSDVFAAKLAQYNVTVNSVHPGMTKTDIFHHFFNHIPTPYIFQILWSVIMALFAKSSADGAQTSLHVAVAKETQKGKHFWDCAPFRKPRICKNRQFCNEIWTKCCTLVCLEESETICL